MTDLNEYRQELKQIDADIASDGYKPGPWQRLIKQLEQLPKEDRSELKDEVTEVSNALHGRNGFARLPVAVGFAMEVTLLVLAAYLLADDNIWLRLIGVVALGASLQPSLKIITAMLFGVRYAYVFLWYFEPRFKMQYGTYLLRSRVEKVIINLMGSLGTPLALLAGYFALVEISWLSLICLFAALGAAGMQVAAFVAALVGVRKVGPFLLTNLTTPAMLGSLLREKVS